MACHVLRCWSVVIETNTFILGIRFFVLLDYYLRRMQHNWEGYNLPGLPRTDRLIRKSRRLVENAMIRQISVRHTKFFRGLGPPRIYEDESRLPNLSTFLSAFSFPIDRLIPYAKTDDMMRPWAKRALLITNSGTWRDHFCTMSMVDFGVAPSPQVQ